MINDVALTRHAATFTDTFHPRIFRVPIGPQGKVGRPATIWVTGPAGVSEPGTFGGIVRADGRVATRNYIGILTSVN